MAAVRRRGGVRERVPRPGRAEAEPLPAGAGRAGPPAGPAGLGHGGLRGQRPRPQGALAARAQPEERLQG